MTPEAWLAIGGLAILLGLIIAGAPIALAMILVGVVGTIMLTGSPHIVLAQFQDIAYALFSNYNLSIIPLFVLMGQLSTKARLSEDVFAGIYALFGRRPASVGVAAIGACASFGALCGSSLATAATMGQVAYPELRKRGYTPSVASGTLAAGGTLGILIPPSLVLIVYAVVVEANIVALFAAALVPGLLATGFFMVVAWARARRATHQGTTHQGGPSPLVSAADNASDKKRLMVPLIIFLVVIGGLFAGFYTANQAAALGVLLIMALGLYRARAPGSTIRPWRDGGNALVETANTTAMIYLILFGAQWLNIFLARAQFTTELATLVGGFSPYGLLFAMLFAFLVLGCVLESFSMVLLAIPVFFPILAGLDFGLDPEDFKLWFGVLALVVIELGLITPPLGLNVFVIKRYATDARLAEIFLGATPFLAAELARILILVALPVLSLGLPRLLGY